MPIRERDSYCIQSVENALALLEALCEEGDEVSLSRLSERLDMKKASLFRLLATFENHGYVEREQGSRKYRLGLSAYEIGQKFLSRMSILRKARSVMDQLAREFDEAAYLIVRRQDEVLFLEMVDCAQQVKIVSLVGKRFPVASTAAGKIFLAFQAETPIDPPLPGTATSDLINPEEAGRIRAAGYCIDHSGVGEGTTCLAVPLFSAEHEVAGTLALLGPDFRMSRERIEQQLLPALVTAGEVVSSRLGYLGHVLGEKHQA